jgi:hypothetical protein
MRIAQRSTNSEPSYCIWGRRRGRHRFSGHRYAHRLTDPADYSAVSISMASDPVLPRRRVVAGPSPAALNDRTRPQRKDCDSRQAGDSALCRARSSGDVRVSARQLPVILCALPMTDCCARPVLPSQTILCQPEPASPLICSAMMRQTA